MGATREKKVWVCMGMCEDANNLVPVRVCRDQTEAVNGIDDNKWHSIELRHLSITPKQSFVYPVYRQFKSGEMALVGIYGMANEAFLHANNLKRLNPNWNVFGGELPLV